jgi:trehalose 6-phosphate phosphatase
MALSLAELLPPGRLAALAPAQESAFFLDVDGTLLEIKPRPEDVVADEVLTRLLKGLQEKAGGALALVSGRRIDDVDRIFSPLKFACAGLHGAEMRFPDGSFVRLEADGSEALARARSQCKDFIAENPGARLEDKGAALALHFRERPDLEGKVLAFAQSLAGGGFAVQEGKMVAELKDARASKGNAIKLFLSQPPFAGRRPVFIGDDVTDESGFQLVNVLGGVSVRVGSAGAATTARYFFRDVAETRRELGRLVAEG